MSTKNESNHIPEEIDLFSLKEFISKAISNSIMNTFLFLKKNVYKLSLLFIIGLLLGVVVDYLLRSYVAEVVVNSNFTSKYVKFFKSSKLFSFIVE